MMTIWRLQRHNKNKKAKSLENSKKIHKFAGETLLLIQINKTMKKIFTLISMALVAMSANAQDKYAAVDAEGNMAAEFTVVVDAEGNATNVADGKSIVTITTENLVLEAVGGTTPANISGGAQDITPGTSMGSYTDSRGDVHEHAYEVGSVGSWANVTWKQDKKSDPIDQQGTRMYNVLGSGNPYVNMFCEEIYTEGEPTGNYRAFYDFYKPGNDLPEVGLYYKFMPKVDGKLKVQVWANKGNRNTYLINGETKEAVAYSAEGYVNGQKINTDVPVMDETTGEQKLDNDGNPVWEQILKFFTAEEIAARHAEAKVVEGVDTAPYVIDTGGQPFWGWITFDVTAGSSYWLFQDSSQVGFGGFEFSGSTGISNVKSANEVAAPRYNLAGQKVSNDYKGVVIQNGHKFMVK